MTRIITLFVLLMTFAVPVMAFGPTGHRAIGLIAEQHLNEAAREQVRAILGHQSLAEVATWSDEIRSDDSWDHASSWHWVTIEDKDTYASSRKNPKGDVIMKTREFITTLGNPKSSRQEKALALKWLVHLVGDIHQPLHVGRGADRGGNEIKAEWFRKPTNMHRIWDSEMIESTRLSYTELAAFANKATSTEVSRWQKSNVLDWAGESIELRSAVYTVPDNPYEYSYQNLPIVKRRLSQAGVRLAGIINASLGK